MKNIPKIAVILGNGPSLKGFDFKGELHGVDSFGINAAYRYWDKINWYPTHFVSCDPGVCSSHKEAYCRLVRNRQVYGIKKFLLDVPAIQHLRRHGLFPSPDIVNWRFWFIRKFINTNMYTDSEHQHFPSGALAALWAATLGYDFILLLGIDMNYSDFGLDKQVIGYRSQRAEFCEYILQEDINSEENYFFDNYLQKGDPFSVKINPEEENLLHQDGWSSLEEILSKTGCQIINANPKSRLEIFPKMSWNRAKQKCSLQQ